MTKIVDILAAGPSHSFEFFPPKTPAAELQLEETMRELEPLHPSFVSVTYGAGGSTREMTHDIVTRINRETSLTAMAHLTCAAHTRRRAHRDRRRATTTRASGTSWRCAVIRPRTSTSRPAISRTPPTSSISCARWATSPSVSRCIPKAIPRRPTARPTAGARPRSSRGPTSASRSSSSRPSVWFEFLGDLRELGVTTRVIPGIMPVLNVKSVKRMAEMSGADFPKHARATPARGRGRRGSDARRSASRPRPSCAATSWPAASTRSTSTR